jgi:hypothetical protein
MERAGRGEAERSRAKRGGDGTFFRNDQSNTLVPSVFFCLLWVSFISYLTAAFLSNKNNNN